MPETRKEQKNRMWSDWDTKFPETIDLGKAAEEAIEELRFAFMIELDNSAIQERKKKVKSDD